MNPKSRTRLTTKWVASDLCGEDFLTCKNCKDKNIKIRRAYRKDYCEMWEYCPKCGAKFVKRKHCALCEIVMSDDKEKTNETDN